ncbi:YciI family protein [Botrimarina sp.]|uniref:YciI family protein n=1 Tax=Botrimarina sp. TaxID=2795802 RepID=UPI0032ED21A0
MRVMVIVHATESSEAGQPPSAELFEAMDRYNQELVAARVMLAGEGLKPSSEGVRVRFSGDQRTVIDGPFAETKELVAGYWIWEVASVDDAVAWLKRCPNPMPEDSEVEIRPIYAADDFAELDPTGEFARREEASRKAIAMRQAAVHSYLFFNGRCEEALDFYRSAAGAVVGVVMRFNESPDPATKDMVPPDYQDKIMHCDFTIGQTMVMASDGCGGGEPFGGFRLAITAPTEADCDRVFDALAEGGAVDMPLQQTFWSPRYGMLTDKFGVGWMVMVPGQP